MGKRRRSIELPGYSRYIFIAALVGLLLMLTREQKETWPMDSSI
jgi:hypothetical protein